MGAGVISGSPPPSPKVPLPFSCALGMCVFVCGVLWGGGPSRAPSTNLDQSLDSTGSRYQSGLARPLLTGERVGQINLPPPGTCLPVPTHLFLFHLWLVGVGVRWGTTKTLSLKPLAVLYSHLQISLTAGGGGTSA